MKLSELSFRQTLLLHSTYMGSESPWRLIIYNGGTVSKVNIHPEHEEVSNVAHIASGVCSRVSHSQEVVGSRFLGRQEVEG
jgi:hypothetical protein